MRIAELSAAVIALPLRKVIAHASHSRNDSRNLVVRCRLSDGTEGWGEGVPRAYVTGETAESSLEMFARTPLRAQLTDDCQDWIDVIAMCDRIQPAVEGEDPRGCLGNAFRCAVELSILDAFGKVFGQSVSRVIEHVDGVSTIARSPTEIHYSTTITAETARKERISALKMRLYGFRQCKVKVGVAGQDDVARLRRIRRWIGRGVDLRIDANEAWSLDEAAERISALTPMGITAVEQPVRHADLGGLAEIRREIAVPIMLDESLTSMSDAEHAHATQACDVFNIRLSKCGGYLNSLRIAAFANRVGLGYQLGCHPGETGILSAAGRHFATTVDSIRYLEGSYDKHLLRELPTNEDITFGYGGRACPLTHPGLGVTMNERVLDAIRQTASPCVQHVS